MENHFDRSGEYRVVEPGPRLFRVLVANQALYEQAAAKANSRCSLCGVPFNQLPNKPCVCSVCRSMLDALKHNVLIIIAESYATVNKTYGQIFGAKYIRDKEGRPMYDPKWYVQGKEGHYPLPNEFHPDVEGDEDEEN